MSHTAADLDLPSKSGFVHASAVIVGEAGLLIRGASRSGKSRLTLTLIETASPSRFIRLVGDDRIGLEARHRRLIGRAHPSILGQIERRGDGIETLAYEPAAVMRLIIHLLPHDRFSHAEPAADVTLCNISIPVLCLDQAMAVQQQVESVLAKLEKSGTM